MLDSVRQAVQEVINAGNIEEPTDCKKLVDPEFIYCLRIAVTVLFSVIMYR